MQSHFNPKGWQIVAGGRSGAQTPGQESVGSVHPGGMPELCDPSGVGGRLSDRRSGGVAALDPRYDLASLQLARTAIASRTLGSRQGRVTPCGLP